MTGPDSPLMKLTWTDHVTGRQGHLVVDRLVRAATISARPVTDLPPAPITATE